MKKYIENAGSCIITKSLMSGETKLRWLFREKPINNIDTGWIAFGDIGKKIILIKIIMMITLINFLKKAIKNILKYKQIVGILYTGKFLKHIIKLQCLKLVLEMAII